MRSIAGVLMGKDRHTFVVIDDMMVIGSVRVRGNRVYCHKCERTILVGGAGSSIVTPDRTTKDHSMFTILAVGDEVKIAGVEPLAQLTTPEHGFYVRSPYNDDEYWFTLDDLGPQLMIEKGADNGHADDTRKETHT